VQAEADAGPPALRAVLIVSDPPGAAILLDRADTLARTPAVLTVDPRAPAPQISIELEGFVSRTSTLDPERPEHHVELAPLAPEPAPTLDAGLPDAGAPASIRRRRPRRR
jgi:hypothetical protein